MKTQFSLYKELLNDNDILSYVFLECVGEGAGEIAKRNEGKTKEEIEASTVKIELFINDKKVDVRKFFTLLMDQYNDQVKRVATQLVKDQTSEKLQEVSNKIYDLNEVINHFAEEINWDLPKNPFAPMKQEPDPHTIKE